MTYFISLTLEKPIPNSCHVCDFSYTENENDYAYCPAIGDISEWFFTDSEEHSLPTGWSCRHPDCKLQIWEAHDGLTNTEFIEVSTIKLEYEVLK